MTLSPDAFADRARALRLLLFDVDGVLTDGSVDIASAGQESKRFWIRDGSALIWAQREGLDVGLLSGRPSDATTRRAAELGIGLVVQGIADKKVAYADLIGSRKLDDGQVAYMGDDLLDLPVLTTVGLSAAPANAVDEVRDRVHWISRHDGGRGAVREFIEALLQARGHWARLVASFTE